MRPDAWHIHRRRAVASPEHGVTVDAVVKFALLAGLVTLTAGAVFALLTEIAIAVDVVTAPRLSVAFAVKE